MSVWCGYCHKRGHNARGCEKLKEMAAKEPNGWAGKKLARWKESDARRKQSPRRCSYCKETGHNRRKCPSFDADRAKAVSLNKEFCTAFLKAMAEEGLGVGSLIKHNRGRYSEPISGLITEVVWEKININAYCDHRRYDSKQDIKVNAFGHNGERSHYLSWFPTLFEKVNVRLPRHLPQMHHEVSDHAIKEDNYSRVVGKINKEVIMKQAPQAWKDGELSVDSMFVEAPGWRSRKLKKLERSEVSGWLKADVVSSTNLDSPRGKRK